MLALAVEQAGMCVRSLARKREVRPTSGNDGQFANRAAASGHTGEKRASNKLARLDQPSKLKDY